jgi:hypothetical protein
MTAVVRTRAAAPRSAQLVAGLVVVAAAALGVAT